MPIEYKITEKNFELIAQQVGAILTAELSSQAANFYQDICEDVMVYFERIIPLDKSEEKVIIVSLSEGGFNNHHGGSMDGTYQIMVKIFCNSAHEDEDPGDKLAAIKAQRLLGICVAIMQDPLYATLGFDPGFIETVRCRSFETGDIKMSENDASNTRAAVFIVEVRANEEATLPEAIPLASSITAVTLEETDRGYLYVWGEEGTLPPDPRYVYIKDQDGNTLERLEGGQSYTVEVLRAILQTLDEPPATIIQTLD